MDFVELKWIKFVYFSVTVISITDARDLCNAVSIDKNNYGEQCISNFECRTNFCSLYRCGCPSNSFYDACSSSCVPRCGSTLNSDGLIVSPSDLYTQGTSCYWTINGSSGTYVTLVVDEIDMYSYSCASNYLRVTDINSYQLIDKVCYRNYTNPTIVTSSNYYMSITYVSAYSGFRGFRGKYYIRNNFSRLSEVSGYIASPGFPVKYPRYSNYTWLISGKPEHIITLSLLSVSMECGYDMVNVYDGAHIHSPLLVSICNVSSSSSIQDIRSSTSQMLVNFRSDVSNEYNGFSAFYLVHGRPYGQSCNATGQCAENFTCINSHCGCQTDHYYDRTNQSCLNDLIHGQLCSVSTSEMCASHLNCSTDRSGLFRCLCPINQYHYLGYCYSDSELSVTITTETVIQTNSVYLKWTTVGRRSDVYYTVTWVAVSNSTDRGYNQTNTRDTYMVNLTPATEYELTISVILSSDSMYYSKLRNSSFRIETRRPYGYICFGNSQCDEKLNCIGGKCVCLQDQYFHNFTSTCMTRLSKGQECSQSAQCQDSLTCIDGSCECPPGQYYHTSLKTCRTVQMFGSICNISIKGMCRSPAFVCIPDYNGLTRCLCPNNTYFNDFICTDNVRNSLSLSINQAQINLSSHIGLSSVNVSWKAIDDSLDHGSNFTHGNVISMTKLTPGQEYVVTVDLYFTSDGSYPIRKHVQTQLSLVTLPANPGPLRTEESNLRQPPYTLEFSPSKGFVKTYQITLTSVISKNSPLIRRVICPELTIMDLLPYTYYNYEIIAYNKYGNRSVPTTGDFYIGEVVLPPVTQIPEETCTTNDKAILIGLLCVGWTIAAITVAIICVQCFRIRKITRNNSKNTQLEIEKQKIQPRGNNRTLSDIQPAATNDYRDVPKPCRAVSYISPGHITAEPDSSVYVNDSYQPADVCDETNDDMYESIRDVSDDHIYYNK